MLAKKWMSFYLICLLVALTGCVTVEKPKPVVVNGYAGYLEKIALPIGAKINIALIDFNTPGAIISQKNFDVARVPVPFKFILSPDLIDKNVSYGVVAMITVNKEVIFQTYDRFTVINNGKFTTEVIMKRVK